MPPLRDRVGDIMLLSGHFLRTYCEEAGREILGFTDAAKAAMQRYAWPGNVRELENAIERAVVLCRRPQIDVEDLPETLHSTQHSAFSTPHSAADSELLPDTPMPLALALESPER